MSQLICQCLIMPHVAPLMPVRITWRNKSADSINCHSWLFLPHVNANACVCVSVHVHVPPCCLCVSSLAFGNSNGLAVVDYLQKTILLCMSTLDLYGAADPYQRLTRSPRRNRQSTSGNTHTHTTGILTRMHVHNWLIVQPHNKVTRMRSLHPVYHLFPILLSTLSVYLYFFCLLSTPSVCSSFQG